MTSRKILVTGGAGFIGSHVADRFVAEGWTVTVVDDLVSGKRENVPREASFREISVNSEEFAAEVRDGKYDVVAHLAAQIDVRKSVADPVHDARVNILGTLNLMEALRQSLDKVSATKIETMATTIAPSARLRRTTARPAAARSRS